MAIKLKMFTIISIIINYYYLVQVLAIQPCFGSAEYLTYLTQQQLAALVHLAQNPSGGFHLNLQKFIKDQMGKVNKQHK